MKELNYKKTLDGVMYANIFKKKKKKQFYGVTY